MSARRRSAGEGARGLADTPFLDDAERAESDWLLARDSDRWAPAPSSKIASDHAELEDLLGDLPLGPADPSWQEEVLRTAAALASPPRRWQPRAIAGSTGAVLIATAAAAAWLLWPRPDAGELDVAIRHVDRTRSDLDDVVVGDRLIGVCLVPAVCWSPGALMDPGVQRLPTASSRSRSHSTLPSDTR
jgi:hypothetical protein